MMALAIYGDAMRHVFTRYLNALIVCMGIVVSLDSQLLFSQTYVPLYSFKGESDGSVPNGTLISDHFGNLYGTTSDFAGSSYGTVFELHRMNDSTWNKRTLHQFRGNGDGRLPQGRLFRDSQGNLYGTTISGGTYNGGTVFELIPPAAGASTWTERVLYEFRGGDTDGAGPTGGLISDRQGHLYGTTSAGGPDNDGTVFELSPDGHAGWTESLLHAFKDLPGSGPYGGLVMNKQGHLFGTTFRGGGFDGGTAFELSPIPGGAWQFQTIHDFADLFTFGDGSEPIAGMIIDADGNLYGTTLSGGDFPCYSFPFGCGSVFEISPNEDGTWSEQILHSFHGEDGFTAYGELAINPAGTLFGTTEYGGNAENCYYTFQRVGCGTAFRLSRQQDGTWNLQVLMNFAGGGQGGFLSTGLVIGGGHLYGTSPSGGQSRKGFVFQINAP